MIVFYRISCFIVLVSGIAVYALFVHARSLEHISDSPNLIYWSLIPMIIGLIAICVVLSKGGSTLRYRKESRYGMGWRRYDTLAYFFSLVVLVFTVYQIAFIGFSN